MIRYLLVLVLMLCLQACSVPYHYTPEEYPIENGKVTGFTTITVVNFVNNQDDNGVITIYGIPEPVYVSDYQQITEQLVLQLDKELKENTQSFTNGETKNIQVKVTHAQFKSHISTFFNLGTLTVEVSLGNGVIITKNIANKSPSGIMKVMNGAIAIATIEILNDKTIKDYIED